MADESGVPFETVKNISKARQIEPPSGAHLIRLAKALDRHPGWLLGELDDPLPFSASVPASTFAPVRNRVAAGAWRESGEPQAFIADTGPALANDAYRNYPQWWEEVDGESVNQKFPNGSLVRVVDAPAMGYIPRVGDMVVIERERSGLFERTIKRVVIKNGQLAVQGCSTDPRWNEVINLTADMQEDQGDTVKIVGFVPGEALLKS